MKKLLIAASIAALTSTANAALHQRGAQMVYDDVLDITWLLDANHAATSGYAEANKTGDDYDYDENYGRNSVWSNGRMGWQAAKTWVSQLTITDATYGIVSGWRLTSANLQTPVVYSFSYNGSSDFSYNITRSELGHMFFNNLGNKAKYDINGNPQSGYGVTNSTYTGANGNKITIQNLQNYRYWNKEANAINPDPAWVFLTDLGVQSNFSKHYPAFAWAVRDGDIAKQQPSEVPLPAAAWLFGSALVGLVGLRKKK